MKRTGLIILLSWIAPWLCIAQLSLDIKRLVEKVAPQVWLHSNENYKMSSVDWYLSNVRKEEKMESFEEYLSSPYPNSTGGIKTFWAYHTDPNVVIINNVTDRNINDHAKPEKPENFVLAHKNGSVGGGMQTSAKCYVNVRESYYQDAPLFTHDIDIQYYYFYPFNGTALHHDADWETIIVKVSPDGTIKKVGMSSHGKVKWYNPNQLEYTKGHPVVYAAQKSHAFYESAGTYIPRVFTSPDKTNRGIAFDSWYNYEIVDVSPNITHNVSITQRNWLDYTGYWGKKGSSIDIIGETGDPPAGPKVDHNYWSGKRPNSHIEEVQSYVPLVLVPYEPDVKGNTYPSSVIAGPADVCSTSDAIYTINTTKNVQVEWQVSPEYLVTHSFDPTQNRLFLRGASPSSQGWVTIKATIRTSYNGYTVINGTKPKKVWVGRPAYSTPNQSIEGPTRIVQGTFGDFDAPRVDGVKSFQWIVPPGWSVSHASSSAAQIHVGNSAPGNYQIEFRATSDCSVLGVSAVKTVEVYTVGGGGGGNPSDWVQGANPTDGSHARQSSDHGDEVLPGISSSLEYLISVFPNPTTGHVQVKLPSDPTMLKDLNIKVFDLSGQFIDDFDVDNSSFSNLNIDLTNKKKGIYVLKIYSAGNLINSSKIIKQ